MYIQFFSDSPHDILLSMVVWAIIGAVVTPVLFSHRGRSVMVGLLLGTAGGAIGGIVILAPIWLLYRSPTKKCPKCAENVKVEALVCKHCGHRFDLQEVDALVIERQQKRRRIDATIVLGLIAVGLLMLGVAILLPMLQNTLSMRQQIAINQSRLPSPVENDFNGSTMVWVPEGCFIMGEDGEGGEQCFDESFWISKFEVTNAEYAEFIAVGGYDNPEYWTDAGWQTRQLGNWTQPGLTWDNPNYNAPTQPVVGVSWYEAMAYATWRSCRLPTEAEWEYAASGPAGLNYPWGNSFDGRRLNFCDSNCDRSQRNVDYNDGYRLTSPVGTYPAGASWVGALDMAGNVSNWTLSEARDYPYDPDDGRETIGSDSQRVCRGSSWQDYHPNRDTRSYARNYLSDPHKRYNSVGFRLLCWPD